MLVALSRSGQVCAKALGIDVAVDAVGNLRLRKKATPGYENAVRVAIQGSELYLRFFLFFFSFLLGSSCFGLLLALSATMPFVRSRIGPICLLATPASHACPRAPAPRAAHMDMVTTKTENSTHDFTKDGVKGELFDGGKWLRSMGAQTTLGADDGVGVASGLAVMADPTLVHGPLECIFTTDEESTMEGAINLDQSILQAQAMINVDSEEDHRVCVGCAGGAETQLFLPVERSAAATGSDFVAVKLSLAGFHGGHTGTDIHKNHANALQVREKTKHENKNEQKEKNKIARKKAANGTA